MELKKTPLHDWHSSRAKMVPFANYDMPVMYNSPSSITIEHLSVRNSSGVFDVSHMGRMLVSGEDALKFLNYIIPRDLSKLIINKVAYCYFLNEQGGFRDDLTVARTDEFEYLLTWNAGNYEKIWHWVIEFAQLFMKVNGLQFEVKNITLDSAMFAFQGPNAPVYTEQLFGTFPGPWKTSFATFKGIKILILGSGYTGEAGCEIIVYDTNVDKPANAITVWEGILELGEDKVRPCALGSRDSLRTEAGMCLYGQDITESINPIEAGLFFPALINMNKEYFIGQHALEKANENKANLKKRIGLKAVKKGPSPRPGMKIFVNDKEVGHVTSGVFSPLLKVGVGIGYVDPSIEVNTEAIVRQEGKGDISVIISNFPIYDPDEYGSKRKKE